MLRSARAAVARSGYPASIRRILIHRGEPTEPPPIAPARGPPYWKSKLVLRRTADAPAERSHEQSDLFHT